MKPFVLRRLKMEVLPTLVCIDVCMCVYALLFMHVYLCVPIIFMYSFVVEEGGRRLVLVMMQRPLF